MQQPNSFRQTTRIISYDGVQSYNSLISGEQVTVHFDLPFFGDAVGKFIFGKQDELLGILVDTPLYGYGEKTLMLYNVFGYQGYLRLKMKMYGLDGTTPHLLEERRYDYVYNRPVDPSYFELP